MGLGFLAFAATVRTFLPSAPTPQGDRLLLRFLAVGLDAVLVGLLAATLRRPRHGAVLTAAVWSVSLLAAATPLAEILLGSGAPGPGLGASFPWLDLANGGPIGGAILLTGALLYAAAEEAARKRARAG